MIIFKGLKMEKLRKVIQWFCAFFGVLGFCMLSGAVPENPNGLQQGIIATVIMVVSMLVGVFGDRILKLIIKPMIEYLKKKAGDAI